jgi:predicted TIM-barrel enzyme
MLMKGPLLQPVIHVNDEQQALEQTDLAKVCGADGVWLINHGVSGAQLWNIFLKVRERFPDFWIGLNLLDASPLEAMGVMTSQVNGLWTDNASVREDREVSPKAERVWKMKQDREWGGLYFGGVAFKGQRKVQDAATAAKRAVNYMDVVTTSGLATGSPPPLTKIKEMRSAMGPHPLAIASGIDSHNVKRYLDDVDVFLVATGIAKTWHELNPDKVRELAEIIHGGVS